MNLTVACGSPQLLAKPLGGRESPEIWGQPPSSSLNWMIVCQTNSMFCPECRAEYREGFTQCSDCQVPLVQDLPSAPEPQPHLTLVTVLETIDRNLLIVAKSVLDDAEMDYVVEGESITDPLGAVTLYGRKRPTRLQVAEKDEQASRDLLSSLLPPHQDEDQ